MKDKLLRLIFRVAKLLLYRKKIFASRKHKSDSENGYYALAILKILKSQKSFDNFKKSYFYREILEHVTYDQGAQYLKILQSRKDNILDKALISVLINDDVGSPLKYKYNNVDFPLSTTTLRYVKVASDLKNLFGSDLGSVAEIGCGYGGQALINDQLLKVKNSTLFDLPFVIKLIDRYLNEFLLNGSYKSTLINKEEPHKYDLVISNYAFSELPAELQIVYINKVLKNSTKGYLTMNSGLNNFSPKGKLSLNDLHKYLPKFEVFEEDPLTGSNNYILVWGHNIDLSDKIFKKKII